MTGRAIFTDSDEKRWFRDAPDDSDDLLPLDHPAMKKALAKCEAARLHDEKLSHIVKGHKAFEQSEGWTR